jgi:hypothetical protein
MYLIFQTPKCTVSSLGSIETKIASHLAAYGSYWFTSEIRSHVEMDH